MNQETTVQSLLERFNNAEKKTSHGNEFCPDHNEMEWEFQRLLSSEFKYGMRYSSQVDIDTLQEFKEHFDWDAKYGVTIKWEVDPSTASQLIDCDSSDDMAAYLSGAKEPECPTYDDIHDNIDYGCELTGDFSTDARIRVSNLRPKHKKVTKKYLVNLVLECDGEAASLEEYLNEIFNQSTVIKQAQVCSVAVDA